MIKLNRCILIIREVSMEEEILDISQEVLDNINYENLIDIKEEVDDLMEELDNTIAICNEALNS